MSSSSQKNETLRQYCRTFSEVYQEHYGRTPPEMPVGARAADDGRHLDLLAVFHYVLSGLTALFACIPLIHLTLGIAFLAGAFDQPGSDEPPAIIGWVFVTVGTVMVVLGWSLAILMFVTAGKLKKRQHYTFCIVAAGIECIFMPLGTVLGVFTIILLNRASAAALFAPSAPDDELLTA